MPAGDKYFLGRANFQKGVNLVPLNDTSSKGKKVVGSIGNFFSFAMQYLPDGFLQMIFIDTNGFDKQHYKFDYVRREFLGEVRCLVFDVTPVGKEQPWPFPRPHLGGGSGLPHRAVQWRLQRQWALQLVFPL